MYCHFLRSSFFFLRAFETDELESALFYKIDVVIEDFWHITIVCNIVAKSRGGRQILDATVIAYVWMHARPPLSSHFLWKL